MPVVAIVLSRGLRWLVYPAAFGFLAFGAYSFLANVSEPPITKWLSQDREAEYFLSVPVWHTAFVTTAEVIVASHCDRVGFAIGFDGWEYPIWQLLKNRGFTGTLDSVYDDGQPDNGRLLEALKPCAVIVFAAPAPAEVIRTMQQLQRGLPIPIYAPPAAR
jgi:hypothetical protein